MRDDMLNLRGTNTLRGKAVCHIVFASLLKRSLLSTERTYSQGSRSLSRMDLVHIKANQKSLFVSLVENEVLLSISHHENIPI